MLYCKVYYIKQEAIERSFYAKRYCIEEFIAMHYCDTIIKLIRLKRMRD